MKKVSIIIAAYNAERYIAQTIKSILAQTHPHFDIWIVDDGSTDGTASVVHEMDGPITYLKQTNSGPAAARNLGIRSSTGEYVAIIDADDLWAPEKLTAQIEQMDSENADFSCTGLRTIDSNGRVTSMAMEGARIDRAPDLKSFISHNFITTSSVLVKRSALDEVGLFDESTELRGVEDADLWFRLFVAKKKLRIVQLPLVYYRVHEGNLSGDFVRHQEKRDRAHRRMVDTLIVEGLVNELGGPQSLSKGLARQFSFGAAAAALSSVSGLRAHMQRVFLKFLNSSLSIHSFDCLRRIKHLFSDRS